MAMKIHGENRVGHVTDRHWSGLARRAGLDADRVVASVHALAERVPGIMDGVLQEVQAGELRDRLMPGLVWNCRMARQFYGLCATGTVHLARKLILLSR